MNFFERLAELERERASFAVATVVNRSSPVSSHLGDRAVVFPDGRMEGFVGGSCSRDIVRRQALGALASGRPHLLQIRPDAAQAGEAGNGERVVVPMGCASEGAVDVYIEPHVPARRLAVIGFTPVAQALALLAAALEYEVVRFAADDELADAAQSAASGGVRFRRLDELAAFLDEHGPGGRARLGAVVASQGHYDEAALETLLAGRPLGFVGLLASRKRAANVLGVLAQSGVATDRLATIRNPVGLDIGARSPGEVAVSILAEVIAATPALTEPLETDSARDAVPAALDPVCGMEVDVAGARHRAQHAGQTYYFCCAHCRAAFAAEPDRYLSAAAGNVRAGSDP
ncbi:MAG: XdhC family protein [Vulcanimicrobiaceae bacterium]